MGDLMLEKNGKAQERGSGNSADCGDSVNYGDNAKCWGSVGCGGNAGYGKGWTIRERLEAQERQTLSPYAALSSASRGRDRAEPEDEIRPVYERDRDRVIHSRAFRRLKHKTQVFIAPEDDFYRTRLTHTLEVSQIARTFAKALRLNEDLTEAIALGHDLGHTPFGHAGERVLDRLCIEGFSHVEQGVRVVEVLEREGQGLNLSYEVRDGIRNHKTSGHPATLEGQAVRFADKIAYINHDIDDALRARLFREEDLPRRFTDVIGHTVKDRLNTMIRAVVFPSLDQPRLLMEEGMEELVRDLRGWMFENVYVGGEAKKEEAKVDGMLSLLFDLYLHAPEKMAAEYIAMLEQTLQRIPADDPAREQKILLARQRAVADCIAGMTDDECISIFQEHFVPKRWKR